MREAKGNTVANLHRANWALITLDGEHVFTGDVAHCLEAARLLRAYEPGLTFTLRRSGGAS